MAHCGDREEYSSFINRDFLERPLFQVLLYEEVYQRIIIRQEETETKEKQK
jgi:hypothetical protein